MPFNAASGGNRVSSYNSSGQLGNIYQYGSALPYGPFSGLPRAGGSSGTGTSTSTSTSGKTPEAQKFLNGVLSGQTLPYSPDRVNQMYSQASDMNAAGENALNDRLDATAAVGGASATDPSRTGAKLNTMARRQTANQTSKRDINETATGANFDAQLRAAGMLEQSRMQSEALQNQMSQRALGYMPWNNGGGGSGGNNFTGNTGGLEYQNANLGTFRRPTAASTSASIQANRGTDKWNLDYWNAHDNRLSQSDFDQEFEDWMLG